MVTARKDAILTGMNEERRRWRRRSGGEEEEELKRSGGGEVKKEERSGGGVKEEVEGVKEEWRGRSRAAAPPAGAAVMSRPESE